MEDSASERDRDQLLEEALNAADKAFGLSRVQLMMRAGRLAKEANLKISFMNDVPGKDWWLGLKKRHPQLVLRKPEATAQTRLKGLEVNKVGRYFEALGSIISELGIGDKPECIWHCDETNLPLSHKPTAVCAKKGTRFLPGRTSGSREGYSVLCTINAAGEDMPPMVVVKGKTSRCLQSMDVSAGVPGTIYIFQKNAYSTEELGVSWFTQLFQKHCGPQGPQLLVLDGHCSHEVLGLIEAAKADQISVLAFPPHTTSHLSPLDRSVYGPMKKAFNRVCSTFMTESPNHTINK